MNPFKKQFDKTEFSNENLRSILLLAKTSRRIALNPVPPTADAGNVEHYYHFVFDLLFPLSILVRKAPHDVVFVLRHFGVLVPILQQLFKERVEVLPESAFNRESEIVDVIGMNPLMTKIPKREYANFKKFVCQELQIAPAKTQNKIVLIQRLPPNGYYLDKAVKKGSGTSRRSILNIEDLKTTVQALVTSEYEFCHVTLEDMSFKDQIECFNSAVLVIAQHGAGLANILWMQEKSVVVEFGFKSKKHFENMCTPLNLWHFSIDFKDEHIEVDCNTFSKWLLSTKHTKPFFKTV